MTRDVDIVGVLNTWLRRSQPLAAVLPKRALTAASTWGYDHVLSETSPDNPITYPRLQRMGVRPDGRFVQLVRETRC